MELNQRKMSLFVVQLCNQKYAKYQTEIIEKRFIKEIANAALSERKH